MENLTITKRFYDELTAIQVSRIVEAPSKQNMWTMLPLQQTNFLAFTILLHF